VKGQKRERVSETVIGYLAFVRGKGKQRCGKKRSLKKTDPGMETVKGHGSSWAHTKWICFYSWSKKREIQGEGRHQERTMKKTQSYPTIRPTSANRSSWHQTKKIKRRGKESGQRLKDRSKGPGVKNEGGYLTPAVLPYRAKVKKWEEGRGV